MADEDLVYSGRERKRPPGASALTQRIYGLLVDHPDGMTVSQIHEVLRDGWLDTDAYRAYEQRRQSQKKDQAKRNTSSFFGSPEFQRRAQRWWIRRRLDTMKVDGTARREGTGSDAIWFSGERAPQRMANCEAQRIHLVPLDPELARRSAKSDNTAHLRREAIREALLERLHDGRVKGRTRETLQLAYDYIAGR